jgi:N-acetylglutamate synthase-like GNAT family acetyltransferase
VSAGGDSSPLIRNARVDDAEAIARLLGQLGYPADAASVARRLELLGDDRLVVADLGGAVVGLAQLHVAPSLEYDRPAAKLAAIVVDEAQRGQGVGRALVDAMEAEARAHGCELLYLTTAERRADAHAFYERLGLEYTGRRYAKRLT